MGVSGPGRVDGVVIILFLNFGRLCDLGASQGGFFCFFAFGPARGVGVNRLIIVIFRPRGAILGTGSYTNGVLFLFFLRNGAGSVRFDCKVF